jgi:NACalpha-BTF3-like transcription factor
MHATSPFGLFPDATSLATRTKLTQKAFFVCLFACVGNRAINLTLSASWEEFDKHPKTFISLLGNRQIADTAQRLAREKELAKVSIRTEDVDLIVDEMEISKTKAEKTLREHQGNVVRALASLTN